jgi:hypothetical protein
MNARRGWYSPVRFRFLPDVKQERQNMTVMVEWDNPPQKTIVRYTFSRGWTWEEFHAAIQQGVEMVEGLPYIVNMIIDMSGSSLLPNNVLSNVRNSMQNAPKPYDLAVIVTTNRFIMSIFDIMRRVSPKLAAKHPVVPTLDAARARLADYDRQRTDLPAATQ